MEKILMSRFLINGYQEVALVQGVDKVFRVYVNGKVTSESWQYEDALECFMYKIGKKQNKSREG